MTLIQTDIEGTITRIEDELAEATEQYGDALRKAAESETAYRLAFAKAFVRLRAGRDGEKPLSEKTAEQHALIECEELFVQRRMNDAIERFSEEKCRNLRARLDAVRTLSANVRAQT